MEKITLTYYDVTELGFRDEALSLDFNDVLTDLSSWVGTQDMVANTKVTEALNEMLPVYCHNIIAMEGNDRFITIWNETKTTRGGMTSLPLDGEIGTAVATVTDYPENSIPGYPSYFLVKPNDNLIINVKREREIGSSRRFADYIEKFLRTVSKIVVFENNESESIFDREVTHYLVEEQEVYSDPFFRISQKYEATKVAKIKRNRDRIYKIVRSMDIGRSVANKNGGFMKKLLTEVGIVSPRYTEDTIRIRTEFDFEPSKADLDGMIEKWRSDSRGESDVDIRQGFRLRRDSQKVEWLDEMIKRVVLERRIDSDNVIVSNELAEIVRGF